MIELKNVYKTYRMGTVDVHALVDVSLRIRAGEFIAIMGPSGSGKSTLMHVLGLLDRPDSGYYTLGGCELTGLADEQLAVIRNKFVGFVFQQFHLLARMTALDNAALPLVYAGKHHLREKAEQEIEIVGLKERMHHKPNELSGGQQQRVAIARALVNDPLIILADEPTGNLDSKSQDEIIGILRKLNAEGKTVIVVTHEKEIAACARRIIFIRDGKIISDEVASGFSPPPASNLVPASIEEACSVHAQRVGREKFFEYCRQAAFAMLSHKMRSVLSILGILIGVGAVIAMLALGEGASASIEKQLASLGSNLLMVHPGSSRLHGVAQEAGMVTRFTFEDAEVIKKLSDRVSRTSPQVSGRGQIVYQNKNWNTQIEGVDVDFAEMRAAVPVVGRFFNEHEVKTREKVAVLGATVVRELFADANPIGETIKINLINFKVIGILPAKGASGWRDQDDTIVVPITTAMYRLLGKQYIDNIYVEAKSKDTLDAAQESIEDIIIKQHRLKKDAEQSFEVRNMAEMRQALEATTKTMSVLLGSIAAISLLVGGIGIMNIMLVSVTERTREIGLRKAIGANNQDIMVQFLIEAILLSLIGGILGVLLGTGIAMLITVFAGWAVKISLFSVLLATIFSLVVGIVFGLWPARQASLLDPIEALRYE